jgi:hypothetical protein
MNEAEVQCCSAVTYRIHIAYVMVVDSKPGYTQSNRGGTIVWNQGFTSDQSHATSLFQNGCRKGKGESTMAVLNVKCLVRNVYICRLCPEILTTGLVHV